MSKNDICLSLDLQALSWRDESVAKDTLMDVDAENADYVRLPTPRIHAT